MTCNQLVTTHSQTLHILHKLAYIWFKGNVYQDPVNDLKAKHGISGTYTYLITLFIIAKNRSTKFTQYVLKNQQYRVRQHESSRSQVLLMLERKVVC